MSFKRHHSETNDINVGHAQDQHGENYDRRDYDRHLDSHDGESLHHARTERMYHDVAGTLGRQYDQAPQRWDRDMIHRVPRGRRQLEYRNDRSEMSNAQSAFLSNMFSAALNACDDLATLEDLRAVMPPEVYDVLTAREMLVEWSDRLNGYRSDNMTISDTLKQARMAAANIQLALEDTDLPFSHRLEIAWMLLNAINSDGEPINTILTCQLLVNRVRCRMVKLSADKLVEMRWWTNYLNAR